MGSWPTHRRCYVVLALAIASVVNCRELAGQESAAAESETLNANIMEPAGPAVEKGLAYLSTRQLEDGALATSGYGRNVAVCALAGMAWLSGGSTPDRGPHGAELSRVTGYLLEHAHQSGFITAEDAQSHGPMYGHGFATLYLAEVYGMSPRDDLRDKLERAVELIVGTQNAEGGWRYQPRPEDADLSVTICQVMALRAARNAGIHVPRSTIDRCVDYVRRSQNPDGGFRYMLPAGSSAFPRSAAGVVALYSAGVYEGPELTHGVEYLDQFLPANNRAAADAHFFYGQYYAVQAMWQSGGERWQRWYPAVRETLIARQQADGSWPDAICPEYGTAMATIILQMPNNSVPIFQR